MCFWSLVFRDREPFRLIWTHEMKQPASLKLQISWIRPHTLEPSETLRHRKDPKRATNLKPQDHEALIRKRRKDRNLQRISWMEFACPDCRLQPLNIELLQQRNSQNHQGTLNPKP